MPKAARKRKSFVLRSDSSERRCENPIILHYFRAGALESRCRSQLLRIPTEMLRGTSEVIATAVVGATAGMVAEAAMAAAMATKAVAAVGSGFFTSAERAHVSCYILIFCSPERSLLDPLHNRYTENFQVQL